MKKVQFMQSVSRILANEARDDYFRVTYDHFWNELYLLRFQKVAQA